MGHLPDPDQPRDYGRIESSMRASGVTGSNMSWLPRQRGEAPPSLGQVDFSPNGDRYSMGAAECNDNLHSGEAPPWPSIAKTLSRSRSVALMVLPTLANSERCWAIVCRVGNWVRPGLRLPMLPRAIAGTAARSGRPPKAGVHRRSARPRLRVSPCRSHPEVGWCSPWPGRSW